MLRDTMNHDPHFANWSHLTSSRRWITGCIAKSSWLYCTITWCVKIKEIIQMEQCFKIVTARGGQLVLIIFLILIKLCKALSAKPVHIRSCFIVGQNFVKEFKQRCLCCLYLEMNSFFPLCKSRHNYCYIYRSIHSYFNRYLTNGWGLGKNGLIVARRELRELGKRRFLALCVSWMFP